MKTDYASTSITMMSDDVLLEYQSTFSELQQPNKQSTNVV